MESLEPLINLLILLTVLSVAAERVTNLLKLRDEKLSSPEADEKKERKREGSISARAALIGVFVAVLVKADLFTIIAHLDDPWHTLGWVQMQGHEWVRTSATSGLGPFVYTLGGCVLTGVALGFGSKFWHDVLGVVFEVRGMAKRKRQLALPEAGAGGK